MGVAQWHDDGGTGNGVALADISKKVTACLQGVKSWKAPPNNQIFNVLPGILGVDGKWAKFKPSIMLKAIKECDIGKVIEVQPPAGTINGSWPDVGNIVASPAISVKEPGDPWHDPFIFQLFHWIKTTGL